MIYVSCKDFGDEDLRTPLDYLTRSFHLERSQFVDSPPGDLPVILLQPTDGRYVQGEESLVDFTHPDDCVYLFGASHGQVQPVDVASKVYIPHCPTWSMFPSQAAAIVLYDRFVKRGSFG